MGESPLLGYWPLDLNTEILLKKLGTTLAYLEDKIQQVQDIALRDVLLAEVKNLKKGKKFGLVFEEHVPELVPVYSAPIRPRSTVIVDPEFRTIV
ncbi:hypothetical protein [Methylobacter svalbardensis]|uniref:hypothetical protein n=1 Tax=Methylobacter svalbardensis TaxID=3080016 RepID=UPI0030EE9A27